MVARVLCDRCDFLTFVVLCVCLIRIWLTKGDSLGHHRVKIRVGFLSL